MCTAFLHSAIEEHLGCVLLLDCCGYLLWTEVCGSLQDPAFRSFGCRIPQVELLNHVVVLLLVLWGVCTLFSTVVALIYSLTYMPFLHILTNICHLWSFLMMVILTCMKWHFIIILIYISLIISNTEHFFIYCLPPVCLCKNVFSCLLPVFQ